MVIDLTGDSSSEEEVGKRWPLKQKKPSLTPDHSLELLEKFIVRPSSQHSTTSSSTASRPPSRRSNGSRLPSQSQNNSPQPRNAEKFAVVVRTKSHSGTSTPESRKRSISSAFPQHHGLSSFYNVYDNKNKGPSYKPAKRVERSTVVIRQSRYHFRPKARKPNPHALYQKKLTHIEGPPVLLDLKKNVAQLNFNFEFINTHKLQDGVEAMDAGFNHGCTCDEGCSWTGCGCLNEEVDDEQSIPQYIMGRNGVVVLRKDFMEKKAAIQECNGLCLCGKNCWNRVTQKGSPLRFEVFQTRNRGSGLRSRDSIQAGQFIEFYLGEVITKQEADRREAATSPGDPTSYFFNLDHFSEDDDMYVVDGRKYGSVTRFINHSCNPNCKMFVVQQHHSDQKLYNLAFFALKDIPAGKELTFDYCPNWKTEMDKTMDPNAVKCLCGESNCRGQLWPNSRKTMREDSD
ncbi:hypothetical protein AJ80_03149 [Polytolypa hystricis UAMH7299]|uniref:Histone-lysine N-methyltransferase n=1 Tax=Polytolypa hystricis (strain UAMH7299) TaxID=1447883 RepID=A0A2B7YK97_POLH7|nr:hypothetical protein AJ80_03149 [Polytolypa hystricis UAMH7299]